MVKLTSRETLTKVFNGLDSYVLSLSNDSQVIATNPDGTGGSYIDATTTVTIYKGTEVNTSDWVITAQASTGVTGSLRKNTYSVTSLTTDQGTVTLTATHIEDQTKVISKVFTITKSKKGEPNTSYALSTDRKVIKKYINLLTVDKVGTPSIVDGLSFDSKTLTITAIKRSGSSVTPFSGFIEILEEKVTSTGVSPTSKYFSSSAESSKSYNLSGEDLSRVKINLYKDLEKSNLVDTGYVDVITEGQAAITLVNTNPNIVLPADYKGVVSSYDTATGSISLFEGTVDVTSLAEFAAFNVAKKLLCSFHDITYKKVMAGLP